MDALKFIEERNRMCKFYHKDCEFCIAGNIPCNILADIEDSKLVKLVEEWSTKHPQKTMLQDFLEKYPNAILCDGIPKDICPDVLGYCENDSFCGGHTCEDCWNRLIE